MRDVVMTSSSRAVMKIARSSISSRTWSTICVRAVSITVSSSLCPHRSFADRRRKRTECAVELRDVLSSRGRKVRFPPAAASDELRQPPDDLPRRIAIGQIIGNDADQHRLSLDLGAEQANATTLESIAEVIAKRLQSVEIVCRDASARQSHSVVLFGAGEN